MNGYELASKLKVLLPELLIKKYEDDCGVEYTLHLPRVERGKKHSVKAVVQEQEGMPLSVVLMNGEQDNGGSIRISGDDLLSWL